MNLHQLRFVREAVRQNYNLTDAAKSLFTSQPGVSKAIIELEDELGVSIFARAGKRSGAWMSSLALQHRNTDDGAVARPRATGVTVHGCVTTAGRPTRLPAWLTAMAISAVIANRAMTGR